MHKIRFTKDILILDTPGVYQEKEKPDIKMHDMKRHVQMGVKNYDSVKDPDFIVADLMRQNPRLFEKFYGIEADGDSEILLEELGKRKNLRKKGNLVDTERTARVVLKDWQEGKI